MAWHQAADLKVGATRHFELVEASLQFFESGWSKSTTLAGADRKQEEANPA
jgi:hypothetical protein